jgi:hypothetical protein
MSVAGIVAWGKMNYKGFVTSCGYNPHKLLPTTTIWINGTSGLDLGRILFEDGDCVYHLLLRVANPDVYPLRLDHSHSTYEGCQVTQKKIGSIESRQRTI